MSAELPEHANLDPATVASFGAEWSRFPQHPADAPELGRIFEEYFQLFPWGELPPGGGRGADVGCGSGRWAALAAPRVSRLYAVDASPDALAVARANLARQVSTLCVRADLGRLPFAGASLDFAYSLGVLHHLPDTEAGIRAIAAKLKPGAPFLVYLYYAMDNRPSWYRLLWRCSDALRRGICRLPHRAKEIVADLFAVVVYYPLARAAALLRRIGRCPASFPLCYYADKSLYAMRTDALDRLGTPLERRFTRAQIAAMLERSGFARIEFSDRPPFWCAVARRVG